MNHFRQSHRLVEAFRPQTAEDRLRLVVGEQHRRAIGEKIIELPGAQKLAHQLGPALHEHAGDTFRGALFAEIGKRDALGRRIKGPDPDPHVAQFAHVAESPMRRGHDDRPVAKLVGTDRGQVLVHDGAEKPVEHKPPRTPFGLTLLPGGEARIVLQDRHGPDGDAGKKPAPAVHVGPRSLIRDPARLAGATSDLAVERGRRLRRNQRAALRDPMVKNQIQLTAIALQHAGDHLDPRSAQNLETAPGVGRIRISRADDNAFNPGRDDGIRTRAGSTLGRARLQRHIEGRARSGRLAPRE